MGFVPHTGVGLVNSAATSDYIKYLESRKEMAAMAESYTVAPGGGYVTIPKSAPAWYATPAIAIGTLCKEFRLEVFEDFTRNNITFRRVVGADTHEITIPRYELTNTDTEELKKLISDWITNVVTKNKPDIIETTNLGKWDINSEKRVH